MICQKAMAREVEDRFASMGEFDQALKGIAARRRPRRRGRPRGKGACRPGRDPRDGG